MLLHGLRTEELSSLNVGDYDGQQVQIHRKKLDTKGIVPLSELGKQDLEYYLQWRQASGEVLFSESPLFVSHSRRNPGQRLGYEGIRKAIDQIAQQTGIDFHAYRFRHTFAMNLVAQGISSHHAITLTRHRSIQNFRRYTQAAEQADVADGLDELHLPAKAPD
jgi:integrase/recombinase XerD